MRCRRTSFRSGIQSIVTSTTRAHHILAEPNVRTCISLSEIVSSSLTCCTAVPRDQTTVHSMIEQNPKLRMTDVLLRSHNAIHTDPCTVNNYITVEDLVRRKYTGSTRIVTELSVSEGFRSRYHLLPDKSVHVTHNM